MSLVKQKTVAFHTLGCKLNLAETSSLAKTLSEEGFEQRNFEEQADVYVINTCSVTENADKECRYLVRRIQRQAPQGLIVMTGCYAQLKPKEIAEIPGVDLVLGAAEKFNIASHLRELSKGDSAKICSCDIAEVSGFHESVSHQDRTRAFLKVQDGCDYTCSFCTIPLARGKSRSDTIANVVERARLLGLSGVREVVLTGINLGDFGKGPEGARQHQESFFQLIQALDQVQEVERFRISSIEPNLLSAAIIEFVSNSGRFMPHFHIPLQSGSNKILGLMKRRYRRELYEEKVKLIKLLMPHCCIGVDVIVGFPGESDDDFMDTHRFLHELDISYLHVFTYSERSSTAALDIKPVVPVGTRHERNKQLRSLSYLKMEEFARRHQGQTRKVLFEGHDRKTMIEGYSDNYIRVQTPFREDLMNSVVDWTL